MEFGDPLDDRQPEAAAGTCSLPGAIEATPESFERIVVTRIPSTVRVSRGPITRCGGAESGRRRPPPRGTGRRATTA
mgnify:CR=1 FL=1